MKKALQIIKKSRIIHQFIFIIRDEDDFTRAESLISSIGIEQVDYKPLYTGNNLEFFRQNVLMDEEELFALKPTMGQIFRNSLVNSLNFGRITIMSNGAVHANLNTAPSGHLGKDSLYDSVYKEICIGKNWRRVRKNEQPCKQCHYHALCPSINNYYYAIGNNAFCNNPDTFSMRD